MENAIKKCLIGLFVLAPVVMIMYAGCNSQKIVTLTASGNDTLYTTFVQHYIDQQSRALYRCITQKSENVFDTIISETAPPQTIYLTIRTCYPKFRHTDIGIFRLDFDTIYRIVDDPLSQDTVYIYDTLITRQDAYSDTISCRIDTIEAYLKSHKPYFVNKDSITSLLSTTTEGLRHYISLPAFHFANDSVTIKLIDNPSWVQLNWISNVWYGDCWFYPKCVDGVLVQMPCVISYSDGGGCSVPYLVLAADSTALDSTYNWKVVITNKYAQSDTINVNSTVTPFPYGCP